MDAQPHAEGHQNKGLVTQLAGTTNGPFNFFEGKDIRQAFLLWGFDDIVYKEIDKGREQNAEVSTHCQVFLRMYLKKN
ncbi:MAG: hypothetical protein ACJA0N_000048 [Pseudohongiellaceae bacterium]|jgi:hypothetical protein